MPVELEREGAGGRGDRAGVGAGGGIDRGHRRRQVGQVGRCLDRRLVRLDVAGGVGGRGVEGIDGVAQAGERRGRRGGGGRDRRPLLPRPAVDGVVDRVGGDARGGLPLAPFGSVPVTVTGKLRLVPVFGKGLTVLVGGVVSISHEVESDPVPGLPFWSWMPAALTVSV